MAGRGERYYKGKKEKLSVWAHRALSLRIPFLLLMLGTQTLLLYVLGIESWRLWTLVSFLSGLTIVLAADSFVSTKVATKPLFFFKFYIPLLLLIQSVFVLFTGGILSPALPVLCIPSALAGTVSGRFKVARSIGIMATALIVLLGVVSVVGWVPAPPQLTPPGPMWVLALLHGLIAIALSWLMLVGGVAHTASLDEVAEELEETRREVVAMHQERLVALELMSGRIAHELKNPLAAIKGLTQLLERKGDPTGHLAVIHTEVQHLEEILGGFLSFSRPMDRLRPQPTDMLSLVQEVVVLCRSRQSPQAAAIEVVCPNPVATVVLDPRPIRQVLLNLLLNAQEAMEELKEAPKGPIRVAIRAEPAGVVLTVEDHGPGFAQGMDGQQIDRYFDPYVTTKGRGTGLGLTVSRCMVRAHGGDMSLANRPGGGACVTLRLPWEVVPQEDSV